MTVEQDKAKSKEGRAASACAAAASKAMTGMRGVDVAVAAFGQAQQSQAAINGLVRLLLHKGIISAADLGDSMAWSYREREEQLLAMADQGAANDPGSAIILPPPTARGN